MCFRRKLDAPSRSWRRAARGLDVQRFRVDLESNAIVEAFGADLEETRTIPDGARERDGVAEGQVRRALRVPGGAVIRTARAHEH